MQSPGLQTLFPFPGRKWLNPYPGRSTPPLPLDNLELCGRECLKVSAFLRFLPRRCVCPSSPSAQAPPPERRQIPPRFLQGWGAAVARVPSPSQPSAADCWGPLLAHQPWAGPPLERASQLCTGISPLALPSQGMFPWGEFNGWKGTGELLPRIMDGQKHISEELFLRSLLSLKGHRTLNIYCLRSRISFSFFP